MTWLGYLGPLLRGIEITALVTVLSTLLGAMLAFAAGIARAAGPRPASWIAAVYIEVFRGTSLLVQLFWLYYALPLVGPSFGPVETGILGLALNIGAYGAEVVRGALMAVSREQREAAVALNFNPSDTIRHILLPQALPEMLPPLGNLAVQNLKDSALVSMISIGDLTFRAQELRNLTLATVPIYTLTLLLYFAMAIVIMLGVRLLERQVRLPAARAARAAR